LCGVGLVLVADVTVPIVLAAAFAFVATSRWRAAKFRRAGRKPVLHRVGCRGAIPAGTASADQCRDFAEVTKRST
jgi:hypothetical protein